ncbi:MAG: thiamine pyrophosphate-binding protein [Chromatiales bacterium]|nr:thiamine pyrophosphate-binding protein [Chromatiales bacterium]
MKITVSELIVRYMERLGVEYIFGMPGAHILPVYDKLYDSGIQTVLAKHEQGASFMACGYNRASGKIAACIATAGPGATNLVTGVANAYADKQPVLVITGETSTHIFGKGGLQESSGEGGSIDQTSLFKGITRYNKIIERTDYLAQVLNQTTQTLLSDNPGPVLLSFPFNIQHETVDAELLNQIKTDRSRHATCIQTEAARELSKLILNAKHPVMIAGHGCIRSDAQGVISQLSELRAIPVTTSLKGKGVIDEDSPLALGSLGVTSSGCAYQYITDKADLLILLGASFNERTSYMWDRSITERPKVVQIDNDYRQLEKVYSADIAIHGDIADTLYSVVDYLDDQAVGHEHREATITAINTLKHSTNSDYALFHSGFALIETFFKKLAHYFPKDTVVFDDNIIFAQNFFEVSSENRFYPNSGVSSLGHAIPAAIGSRFSNKKTTFAILGDGGFQMCCMEIMTAVNYRIPLNVVVFNNQTMGLIRKNQHQHYQQRYISCDFTNPDFEQLASSFGVNYARIDSEQDIDRLFDDNDLTSAITIIEIGIDKDAFPNYSSKR